MPSTGPSSPSSIPTGEPESSPQQLALPNLPEADDQPATSGEPIAADQPVASDQPAGADQPSAAEQTALDEAPSPEPTAIFELPADSDETMPELELPAHEPELPELVTPADESVALESGRPELTADSVVSEAPAGEPTVLEPKPTIAEPESGTPRQAVPQEPMPPESTPAAEPTPGQPTREAAVAQADAAPPPIPTRRPSQPIPVERRAERVVHSPLAGPRRRSARDVELDLEAAEREAASEALSAAGEEEESAAASALLEPVIPVTGLAQAGLSPAEIEAATRVAIEQMPGRSARVETCPFLRSIAGGALQAPRDSVDGRNRCAAFGDPLPLSRMQQALVCLQPTHEACPRYVRGAMLIQQRIAPAAPPVRQLPVLISAALLLVAVLIAAAYVLLGGRLEPQPTGTPGVASPTLVAVSPSPTPAPEPTASPSPTPTLAPTPRPTARPTPLPAQYRGLQRCPAPQKCFIYVVRRGDTLSSIARRFNTTVAVLRRMNPEIRGDYLRVGQKVKVPPP
jgi:hypothetical protein